MVDNATVAVSTHPRPWHSHRYSVRGVRVQTRLRRCRPHRPRSALVLTQTAPSQLECGCSGGAAVQAGGPPQEARCGRSPRWGHALAAGAPRPRARDKRGGHPRGGPTPRWRPVTCHGHAVGRGVGEPADGSVQPSWDLDEQAADGGQAPRTAARARPYCMVAHRHRRQVCQHTRRG